LLFLDFLPKKEAACKTRISKGE
jgi:hypothetical protein